MVEWKPLFAPASSPVKCGDLLFCTPAESPKGIRLASGFDGFGVVPSALAAAGWSEPSPKRASFPPKNRRLCRRGRYFRPPASCIGPPRRVFCGNDANAAPPRFLTSVGRLALLPAAAPPKARTKPHAELRQRRIHGARPDRLREDGYGLYSRVAGDRPRGPADARLACGAGGGDCRLARHGGEKTPLAAIEHAPARPPGGVLRSGKRLERDHYAVADAVPRAARAPLGDGPAKGDFLGRRDGRRQARRALVHHPLHGLAGRLGNGARRTIARTARARACGTLRSAITGPI